MDAELQALRADITACEARITALEAGNNGVDVQAGPIKLKGSGKWISITAIAVLLIALASDVDWKFVASRLIQWLAN